MRFVLIKAGAQIESQETLAAWANRKGTEAVRYLKRVFSSRNIEIKDVQDVDHLRDLVEGLQNGFNALLQKAEQKAGREDKLDLKNQLQKMRLNQLLPVKLMIKNHNAERETDVERTGVFNFGGAVYMNQFIYTYLRSYHPQALLAIWLHEALHIAGLSGPEADAWVKELTGFTPDQLLDLARIPLGRMEAYMLMERYKAVLKERLESKRFQDGKVLTLPSDIPVAVQGDYHGHVENLDRFLAHDDLLGKIQRREVRVVIIGDAEHFENYGDLARMDPSIHFMQRIMQLTVENPDNFFYCLGNHSTFSPVMAKRENALPEARGIPQGELFGDRLAELYGEEMLHLFQETWDMSPVIAKDADGNFGAIHAGPIKPLPGRGPVTLDDIKNIVGSDYFNNSSLMQAVFSKFVDGPYDRTDWHRF